MVKEYNLYIDGDKKLSEHFKVKEFACKDGDKKVLIDDDLIEILESLRLFVAKPITIISGYRTKSYNVQCGGAGDSFHCKGMAADIRADVSLVKLAIYAAQQGARGVGIYKDQGFVHIDTRPDRIVFKEQ